jgi:beta-galactosidase
MFTIGTSYYPETIDRSEWERDLDNMKNAGITLIRVLDFAWTVIEPREGIYDWKWLDEFLDMANERKLGVILCTPTATPPAWLARQYPQIMIEARSGERHPFGMRRDVCITSPIYRHFSAQIAALLGKRYGNHPAVSGWQIDNELMGPERGAPPECHCPDCQWQFRVWLRRRYATVKEINESWGTRFWNQEYSDWGEIETPRHYHAVQGQVIDYAHFYSDTQIEFARLQYDALRPLIDKRQYIAHNATGVFNRGINHIEMARAMDYAAWDAYRGNGGYPFPEAFASLVHDLMRSAKHKSFFAFETNADRRGYPAFWAELRAHGGRGMIFWHWRCIRWNQEHMSDTLCDYSGQPKPDRIAKIKDISKKIAFDTGLPDSLPASSAALLYSYNCSRYEIRNQGPWPYHNAVIRMYQPLWQMGVRADVVQPGDELSQYKLVIIPALALLEKEQAEVIRRYVKNGGIAVACARTAHMDLHGKYHLHPGALLSDVFGYELKDIRLGAADGIRFNDGQNYARDAEGESLAPTTASVLATFAGGEAEGKPAALVNSFGKGTAFYVACVSRSVNVAVIALAAAKAGVPAIENSNELVSACQHCSGKGMWYFNHSEKPATVAGRTIPAGDFCFVPREG